jgi:eukaryotic-like serine/threonine-protein kinase
MNPDVVANQASASTGRVAPFGKYLLLQRVSVGGMAEVYKAIPEGATRVDQIVAIKRILPNIAEDREFIGMFIDEARIAGQLNHPNICRIYELGRVGQDHYIAMQFLWGRDLLKVMNRYKKAGQHLPPAMAALIAARASQALHYAHEKRGADGAPLHIIHRDVSPQNIIVGYAGQTKLIDFGVARAATQSQKTQAGILKGKFGYMSPEMIRGLPVDHRSDVFAMGICLHEALTGARLFYGESDFATLELVRDARVRAPSATAPHVPAELDAIVLRALARDPDDRYPTAGALADDILAFLARYAPGFDEAQVAQQMRAAFASEVAREKHRLDTYARMLSAGALVRGASIPALLTSAPPSGERNAAEPGPAAGVPAPGAGAAEPIPNVQTKPSPLSEDDMKRLSGEHELGEERTQIFFSTSELEQLRALSQGPALSSPELGSVVPPPPDFLQGYPTHETAQAEPDGDVWPLPPRGDAYERPVYPAASQPSSSDGPRGARGPATLTGGFQGVAPQPEPARPRPMTLPPGALRAGTLAPGQLRAGAGTIPPGTARQPTPSERSYVGLPAAYPAPSSPGHTPAGQPYAPPSGHTPTSSSPGFPAQALSSGPIGYAPSDASIWEQARSRGERFVETDLMRPAYDDALPQRSRSNMGRLAVLGAGFLALSGLTYFIMRSTASSTATLTIEDVGDPDALVRVDGIVRGNPPLTVEGLNPGVHTLELSAAGSHVARTEVAMHAGEARSVKLVLTPQAVPPSMQPHTSQQPSSSATVALPAANAPQAASQTASAGRTRRRLGGTSLGTPADALSADAPAGIEPVAQPEATDDSDEPAPAPAEQINIDTASLNQGELLISTEPWTHVLLDGQDTGRDTPIRALRVPAGHHVVGLRTEEGVVHEVEVDVEPGRVVRIVRHF